MLVLSLDSSESQFSHWQNGDSTSQGYQDGSTHKSMSSAQHSIRHMVTMQSMVATVNSFVQVQIPSQFLKSSKGPHGSCRPNNFTLKIRTLRFGESPIGFISVLTAPQMHKKLPEA